MEVLVSVAIITVVGLALMQISANNNKLIRYILEKKNLDNIVSMVAGSIEKKHHRTERALYDLMKPMTINHDESLKLLKESKISIFADSVHRHEIYSNPSEVDVQRGKGKELLMSLEISKYRISDGHQNAQWYRLGME